MKVLGWVLAGAVVLGGGYLYFEKHKDFLRAEAEIEAVEDSLEARKAVIERQEVELAEADSALRTARERQATAEEEAQEATERANQRIAAISEEADSLEAELRSLLPEELNPTLSSVLDLYQLEIAQKDTVIASCRNVVRATKTTIDTLEARSAACDSLLTSTRASLNDAISARDHWREEAKPGFFDSGVGEVIKLIGAFLGGWGANEATGG